MRVHVRTMFVALATVGVVVSAASGCGGTQQSGNASSLLETGQAAPEFMAMDQHGQSRQLGELRAGGVAVLFFYPRDGTPGCTREACAFRDAWDKLQGAGATVIGVSTDGVRAHAKFAADHQLAFPLLADPEGTVLRKYGVKSQFGMAERVTFIIGRDGKVARVFPRVDPAVHADEVLAAIKAL